MNIPPRSWRVAHEAFFGRECQRIPIALAQHSWANEVAGSASGNPEGDVMQRASTSSIFLIQSALSCVLLTFPLLSHSQTVGTPKFTSSPIQTSPVSGDDSKQIILMAVSIQPGGAVPPHTHPGDCVGSLVEGSVDLVVQGKETRRLAAGEAYSNPQGTIHWFRNAGDSPARLLNTLVVSKGAPPVQPASAPQQ